MIIDCSVKEEIISLFPPGRQAKVRAFFQTYGDDQTKMVTFDYEGNETHMSYKELATKLRAKLAKLRSGVKLTKGHTTPPGMSIEVILEVLIGENNFDQHRRRDPLGGSSLSGEPHTISSTTNTTYGAS